ncbi:MAG TPA: flagellar protein FliS [Pirellulales bacterium]|nr:flagellar protein FliS [Pirellulales bacterium]
MAYHPAHDAYFENQVITATPQKLRWMAIDGAIRFARQAAEHWRQERIYEGGEAVIGCQRLLLELLSSLKPERAPDLVPQVAGIYVYLSRLLNEARSTRDQKKLAEMIDILEIERETWRLVCEQHGADTPASNAGANSAERNSAGGERLPSAPHASKRHFAPLGLSRFEAGPPAPGFTASA